MGSHRRHKPRATDDSRARKKARRRKLTEGKCPTGKMRFPTRAKAVKELRRNVSELHVRRVYECGVKGCGGWHLTKDERRRREGR